MLSAEKQFFQFYAMLCNFMQFNAIVKFLHDLDLINNSN